jgi:hypothetical protein
MNSTITLVLIIILSLLLWVIYFLIFKDQPSKGETTIIVGFSAVCVFIVKWLLNLIRRKENKV